MSSKKTKAQTAAAVLTALVLTACGSTSKPSATPIKTIGKPVMPPVPAALLDTPLRPEPPESGKPEDLLHHAVRFGSYVQKLEAQNQGWRDWASGF
ncbi:hypothetical protein ACFPVS_09070 [Neisseria weixii]|uniref:hypothetical protein n=1 Tax=Neisseria weixii TaxID=1853276 RepID=UPI0036243465